MPLPRGLVDGEYYHVMHRGTRGDILCSERNDWERMLFYVLYLQSAHRFKNVSRIVRTYSPLAGYVIPEDDLAQILQERDVEVVCFALMPNHFHLLLTQRKPGGIGVYMQRLLTAYTMFFNTKRNGSGHVFQGRYKAVHVKDNRQLLYLSAYIHRNPRELKGWRGKEFEYPWSSLQDYTTANRWGGLLSTDIIASQFGATKNSNYADFVKTSTAKSLEGELEAFAETVTS